MSPPSTSSDYPERRRVALVTYHELPDLADDDRLLIPALARHELDAEPAVWNDPAVDWSRYAAAVVRSTWDYYHDVSAFFRWIARLEEYGVPLYNPPGVLRWNADKRYLRELASAGIPVVPTRWVENGDGVSLLDVLDECRWEEAVVKPAVSASAWETWKTSRTKAGAHEARFRRLVSRGTVMVQPFIAEVARDGEWSLLYLGGEFSHAVVKRARSGDFRVQPRHGGSVSLEQPSREIQSQAESVLRAALTDPARSLYARVDGCVAHGRFLLMELELLEPSLFLHLAPGAPERLARALGGRLG
ncbi:MAG: ATP-grasp domain-containing protein [Gemmatimonadales bacterium]